MDLIDVILTRRSCRNFQDKQVSDTDIKNIIECGLSAPSGMNKQPWFIVALKNKDIMNILNDNAKLNFIKSNISWRKNWAKEKSFNFFYNSPVFFLIFGNKKNYYCNVDCAIAIENMALACESLGLASCIIGDIKMVDKKLLSKNIRIPNNYEIELGLSVGYAKKENNIKRKINDKKFLIVE